VGIDLAMPRTNQERTMITKPLLPGLGIVLLVCACDQDSGRLTDLGTNVAALAGDANSSLLDWQLHFGLNTRPPQNDLSSFVEVERTLQTIPVCEYNAMNDLPSLSCSTPHAVVYNSGSDEQRSFAVNEQVSPTSDNVAAVFQAFRGWHSYPTCRSTRNGAPAWSCTNPPATIYDSGATDQQFLLANLDNSGRVAILQAWRGWTSIPICQEGVDGGWSCSNPDATIYDSDGNPEQRFLTGDFDGDGFTDVIQTFRGWHSMPVCLSRNGQWSCSNPGADIYDSGSSEQQFLAGDFDGLGRTDVIQVYRGWNAIPLCTSTGSGWSCSYPAADIVNFDGTVVTWAVADFNHDGKSDVLETVDSETYVFLSTGSGWRRVDGPGAGPRAIAVDVDGDGLPDIASPNPSGLNACFTSLAIFGGRVTPSWSCRQMNAPGIP
jgi:hypothetical protein